MVEFAGDEPLGLGSLIRDSQPQPYSAKIQPRSNGLLAMYNGIAVDAEEDHPVIGWPTGDCLNGLMGTRRPENRGTARRGPLGFVRSSFSGLGGNFSATTEYTLPSLHSEPCIPPDSLLLGLV